MSQVIVSQAPARNSGVRILVQFASRRDDGTVVNHRVRRWVVDGNARFRMASAATAAAADCGAVSYLHKERPGPDVLSRIWRAEG